MARKIRSGDKVVVVSGAAKGTEGVVSRVLPDRDQVVIEGVNRVKRHMKPSPRMPEGGIIEKDRPIHVSNVMLVDPTTGKPTRVRMEIQDGAKVRVAVGSGSVITAQSASVPTEEAVPQAD